MEATLSSRRTRRKNPQRGEVRRAAKRTIRSPLNFLLIVLVACALFGFAAPAQATGDVQAGTSQAAKCDECHGVGVGKKENPPLTGMDLERHVKAIQDFKSGARDHQEIQMLVQTLTRAKADL